MTFEECSISTAKMSLARVPVRSAWNCWTTMCSNITKLLIHSFIVLCAAHGFGQKKNVINMIWTDEPCIAGYVVQFVVATLGRTIRRCSDILLSTITNACVCSVICYSKTQKIPLATTIPNITCYIVPCPIRNGTATITCSAPGASPDQGEHPTTLIMIVQVL